MAAEEIDLGFLTETESIISPFLPVTIGASTLPISRPPRV